MAHANPQKPVSLDLREMLPVIAAAVSERALQCYQPLAENEESFGCFYSAPCAVGVCVDADTREFFDQLRENSVDALLERGAAECPPEQLDDWILLQDQHDSASRERPSGLETAAHAMFEEFVAGLTAKYGVVA